MFPFDDHKPPTLELIRPFCEDLDAWLLEHPDNIAAVHCKAGKVTQSLKSCVMRIHVCTLQVFDQVEHKRGCTATEDG